MHQARRGDELAGRGRGLDGREFRHGFAGRFFGEGRRFRYGFIGWAGPVFWPYAYDDLFDYVFWPYDCYYAYDCYGYSDLFWAYGYYDLLSGVLWPYALYQGEPYGYASNQGGRHHRHTVGHAQSTPTSVCDDQSANLVEFPIDRIDAAVQPSDDQRSKLNDLKAASSKAADTIKSACSNTAPQTPLGRLDAIDQRVQAMLQAVDVVSKPLANFYNSLSDEQKARFNALGAPSGRGKAQQPNMAQVCAQNNQRVAQFPDERIGQTVQATEQQRADLADLRKASENAANIMKSACPNEMPLTPVGRLDQARTRLQAMLQATQAVRPALEKFYSDLNDEQKAKFNALAQQGQGTRRTPS